MRASRRARRAEIDKKIFIQLHPAALGVAIDLDQRRALLGNLRIELVVPARKE